MIRKICDLYYDNEQVKQKLMLNTFNFKFDESHYTFFISY